MAREKQKKVLKEVSKGKSLRQATKDAGYSQSYADTGRIKESKTWKELVAKYLPEDKIAKRHEELLDSVFPSKVSFDMPITNKVIRLSVEKSGGELVDIQNIKVKGKIVTKIAHCLYPDKKMRKAAVDMAYKVRGSYAPEKVEMLGGGDAETLESINDQLEEIKDTKKLLFDRYAKYGGNDSTTSSGDDSKPTKAGKGTRAKKAKANNK